MPEVPPRLIGWFGWAVRITTPPAAGTGSGEANTLTVVPLRVGHEEVAVRVDGQGAGAIQPGEGGGGGGACPARGCR